MNRFKLSLIALLFSASLFAQDNDTSLYRQLGVSMVEKYVFVHAFIDNDDTCLYSQQKIDVDLRSTYEMFNMGCFGFKQRDEMLYSYDSSGLSEMMLVKEDGIFSNSYYTFNKKGQPLRIVTQQLRTNDSIVNEFIYYPGKYEQPDSSIMMTIDASGDTAFVKTIARFNALGQAVAIVSMDENRELLQEVTYDFKDSVNIASMASTTFGAQAGFMQTFYEHDQHGRVIISYNNINQREEFFYMKNGLLSNIMRYDPKGKLESEVIYKYEYR